MPTATTFGNQLVEGAEIIACRACAEEYAEATPERAAALRWVGSWREGGAFAQEIMWHRFDFRGLVSTPPTVVFDNRLELKVGDKHLVLTYLGTAHSRGDILVHLPRERVLYTGDLLFVGGHPVIWAGPVDNWIKACDYILDLDVDIIVPGHGPIADKSAVREMKAYLEFVKTEARRRISTMACRSRRRRGTSVSIGSRLGSIPSASSSTSPRSTANFRARPRRSTACRCLPR